MNVEEQEKRLLDYKWHERRYSKDTCYILSTQGTEEPVISEIQQKQIDEANDTALAGLMATTDLYEELLNKGVLD